MSSLSRVWAKWKSLQLPWRKRWLAGMDLYGNKFYYYRPTLAARPRRLRSHDPRVAYGDVQISPAWHQWLRYTRANPPSIQEQQLDIKRQSDLKILAQRADERWASTPSVLDKPRRGNMELGVGDGEAVGTVGKQGETGVGQDTIPREEREKERERDAKEVAKGKNPGDGWQPEAWSPGRTKR